MSGVGSSSPFKAVTALGLVAIFIFPAVTRQAELPRELELLRNIKQQMSRNLARVPDYTCLETIARSTRAPERLVIAAPGKQVPFRKYDVVRLEVAEVGGSELFARAGGHNFEKKDISEFASEGLMGNGLFSSFAHDIFETNFPDYKFIGEEEMQGRVLLRFDFKVSQLTSGYRVGTNLGAAQVGFHGSFWADRDTFDAVRLDVIADDVPRYLGLTDAWNRIDFAPVRIGQSDALLPQGGELRTRQVAGGESRNQISFTHCREYGVQSTIHFDGVSESGDATDHLAGMIGTNYIELPSGLQLTLSLETPIDGASAQVGDLISAKVDSAAIYKNKLAVPKGAVVSGRLRRMEQHKEGWPYFLAGLEFTEIEFEGKQSRFFANLEKIILPAGLDSASSSLKRIEARDLPGVGIVSARGSSFRLPEGTRMIWKTLSYTQANEQSK